MFCKKCGNEVADNATFCNKCGAPVAATAAAAPVAAPTGLNLKELILKGVSALFFLLTLIFYSGNTLVASAWGMSQAGPMAGALESGEGGFVNTTAPSVSAPADAGSVRSAPSAHWVPPAFLPVRKRLR